MKTSPPLKSNLVCWLERRRASKGKSARPLNKGAGKREVAFHDPKACGRVSNHVSLLLHSWFHPRAEGMAPITAGSLDPEGLPFFEKSPVILALPYSLPLLTTSCANLHPLQPLMSPMSSFLRTPRRTEPSLSIALLPNFLSCLGPIERLKQNAARVLRPRPIVTHAWAHDLERRYSYTVGSIGGWKPFMNPRIQTLNHSYF